VFVRAGSIHLVFPLAEDQGYFITIIQLPDGASRQRTDAVADRVEHYFLSLPVIHSTDAMSGLNFVFNTRGSNTATMFIPLTDWKERKKPGQQAQALIGAAFREVAKIPEELIWACNSSLRIGLGAA